MGDLTNPKLIKLKGTLFLVVMGLLSSALLLIDNFSFKIGVLLIIAIWSFCRSYHLAFYLIEHYVDSHFKFAGFLDFARHLMKRPTKG